jgi:SAM-dependent methyltransferase
MTSTKEIIQYLAGTSVDCSKIDLLKIKYRPLICPFDKLLAYADSANSAFDIGCGSGQFCSLLAKFSPVKKIFGIEINEKLIYNARELNKTFSQEKEMRFEVFDGKTLPSEMNEYDLVYMNDVFHHVPPNEQSTMIASIFKNMKSGSRLIMKDINKAHPFVIFNKLHDLVFAGEIGKETSFRNMKKILSDQGFQIKEAFTQTIFVYPHYLIVAEKP